MARVFAKDGRSATLSLSAGSSSRWVVFAGSALALVATSALAVLLGEALSRALPAIWLKRGAGGLFVVLGILFLLAPRDARQPPGGAGADGGVPGSS